MPATAVFFVLQASQEVLCNRGQKSVILQTRCSSRSVCGRLLPCYTEKVPAIWPIRTPAARVQCGTDILIRFDNIQRSATMLADEQSKMVKGFRISHVRKKSPIYMQPGCSVLCFMIAN